MPLALFAQLQRPIAQPVVRRVLPAPPPGSMAGEEASGSGRDAPQDVQNGPADGEQPAKPAVKRYRRAELDEDEEKAALLQQDGEE